MVFKILDIFLIGSYIKTMLTDGGHLGWRAGSSDTILKGTTQGPFNQSLVLIAQVVSEKIFNDFFDEIFYF